jgi:transcription elongation GreA/GreB family factor
VRGLGGPLNSMSRAFTRESDGAELDAQPELEVSPHRNLVTTEGLQQIEATLRRLDGESSAARASGDRATLARLERDLRYWRQRRTTAEVVPSATTAAGVRFGNRVTLETGSGATLRYRIVGEDESDPRRGLLSYVSPLAEQLLGCRVGDVVKLQDGDAEVIEIA